MATPLFKVGLGLEDRVIALLERNDFVVLHDRTLDHEFKIDFVVQSFPDNLSFDSIGVQLTCFLDNIEKMKVFLEASRRKRRFRRCLYLEIEQGVDLEREGRAMLMTVLMDCQFNRACSQATVLGARIFADGTYEKFDLAERIRNLEGAPSKSTCQPAATIPGKPSAIVASPIRQQKSGLVTQYHAEKGFGFISSDGLELFFHINSVNDPTLRDELAGIPRWGGIADLARPVTFLDMGLTKKDAVRREARDIRLRA